LSHQVQIAGEVVAIPGKSLIIAAPASGMVVLATKGLVVGQAVRRGQTIFRLTPLLPPQRDLKTTYEADVQSAKSRFEAARQQLDRAQQLLRDLAGSQRNLEAATQEFGQAKAAYEAAQDRLQRLETHPLDADVDMSIAAPSDGMLRQILAAEGQNVTAGAALFEVADFTSVWLRVPVYSGDLKEIGTAATVAVRDIDGSGPVLEGRRVTAPPTADPLAVTSDLYYELTNTDSQLRPGQRLSVTLPVKAGTGKGLSLPASAILYDVQGGTWVYVNTGPHLYRRQRVELVETVRDSAFVSRGVAPGDKVVVQGAAELFGTEFGVGH
jgi:RND family efflux transporter MFP subunit